jgi:glycosyltransferase involved in cell wall biosynthesis
VAARGLQAHPAVKIAQIAPLAESVPPRFYGGTERVVSYLTEELVRLGHHVTLFASGDSQTSAELVACAPRAQRLDGVRDPLPQLMLMMERVRQQAHKFDVLHFHTEHVHLPVFRALAHKTITTLHGRLDLPGTRQILQEFREMPMISISDHQRRPAPDGNWIATVYHGLPAEVCPLNPVPPRGAARYLAFLGRASQEKGLAHAIDIALRTRTRLKIAAKIDPGEDARYWREAIAPRLKEAPDMLQYVGEVDESAKPAFLGHAAALLFPIEWPEPFGLAMIEALSCGTPVIAWPNGSAPEVVEHGVTGFLVESVAAAADAVADVGRLDRTRVRERFDLRFSAERMARDYLSAYRALGRRRALHAVRA